MSLSEKTDAELSELLTEYGVKHGPIVDSTRKLYEKKLQKILDEAPAQSQSDKTFYREEEVVSYISYSPIRLEASADVLKHRGGTQQNQNSQSYQSTQSYQSSQSFESSKPMKQQREATELQEAAVLHSGAKPFLASVPSAPEKRGCCACLRRLLSVLLLLALLAAVGYYVLCQVINTDDKQLQK